MIYTLSVDSFNNTFSVAADGSKLTHRSGKRFKLFPFIANNNVEPVLTLKDLIGRYLSQVEGKDPVPVTVEVLVNKLKIDAELEIELGAEELFEQVVRHMFFDQDGKIRPINLRMLMQTPCTESKESKLADYLVDVLGDVTILNQYLDNAIERLDAQSNALESFTTSKFEYKPCSREAGSEYQRITSAIQKKFESDFEYILGARNRTRDYLIPLIEFYYFTYTAQAILQLNRFLDGNRSECVPLFFRLEWEKTSQNRRCYSEGWNVLQSAAKKIFAHAVTLEILNQTTEQCEPVDYIKLQELINSAPGEDHRIAGMIRDNLVEKLSALYLLPYIKDADKTLYHAIEQRHSPEWRIYAQMANKRYQGARNFVQKLVCDKITQYIDHFTFLFDDLGNDLLCINLINMGDCREVLQGIIRYFNKELKGGAAPEDLKRFVINIYSEQGDYNEFSVLSDQKKLREYVVDYGRDVEDVSEMALILSKNIRCYYRNPKEAAYQYAHLTFYEMESSEDSSDSRMDSIATGVALGGLTSGTPSVLSAEWYKTGFGTKYAPKNRILRMAKTYNALFRVAFTGGAYEPESAIFTEVESGEEEIRNKIYAASNWVVFVDPKVDLSFFKKKDQDNQDLMIIHYSDQYTSASGYDDITVTQKSEQYEEIILDQLKQKGVAATKPDVHNIISLFNAINGGWMLRLISAKKLAGAVDSNFSREKMSILSAVKLCMAYYSHKDIVWIPVSLEEMLRVSGGAGYSQKDGLLSKRNLGFDQGVASDDLLMVGIEGPVNDIKVYLHPVEVKIGQNQPVVIGKAKEQVLATYKGLWKALWPDENRNNLECKLSRNFLMQLIIVCCEKMRLYDVYPNEQWDLVLDTYREALLNEQYRFSNAMDTLIGKGTVISFKSDVLNRSGIIENDVCLLEFPELMGSQYMIKSAVAIEQELDHSGSDLPNRLKYLYEPVSGDAPVQVEEVAVEVKPFIEVVQQPVLEAHVQPVVEGVLEQPILETETPDVSVEFDERRCMEILFGTDTTNGQALIWRPNDTEQVFHTNTGIIGTMGTGKTQFTKSVITQLYRDQVHNFDGSPLGILIFDYKGDYNESKEDFVKATNAKIFKPYHLPFNPLALTKSRVFKPLLPIHTANAFKDTLAKVYGLGAKQQNTLFSCINQAYLAKGIQSGDPSTWDNTPPTFDMVYSIYANDEEIKKNDSLAAAMDKLYQFQVFEGDPNKTESLFKALDGVVVIDLSGYDADIQSLIVAITLDLFYSQMQAAGSSKMDQQYRQLTKLILVDEADNFMSEGFPALKKILKEGREFGVGTILSTQFLKHFGSTDDDYAKYILTWVVHNVADLKTSDVEFVFKTEAKSTETQNLFNDIKGLQKHHSIVKIGTSKPKYIEDKAFWELYKEIKLD